MFILAISCLTTSNLPWFMDLKFQVPMQYCSLQHRTLLLSPVTSTTGYCFCFGSIFLGYKITADGDCSHEIKRCLLLGRKVWCCKEQYCIGAWNVRSMNQGKLEVVKQEMARVNIDILGISKLKWTGMGEFKSDDHYIYYCGQKCLRRKGVAIIVNKKVWNTVLGNTQKRCPFHYRGLECKRRKSRNTWSNGKIWP